MVFQEEKGKKALRSIEVLGLTVMRQGPLGLRAEILGIHAHMGWRGWGSGDGFNQPVLQAKSSPEGRWLPCSPCQCPLPGADMGSAESHMAPSCVLSPLRGCWLQGDCSWEFHEYWFAEHCAYKADGERRCVWCHQLLTTDFRVDGCAHTPGHLPLSFPLQGPGMAPPAGSTPLSPQPNVEPGKKNKATL